MKTIKKIGLFLSSFVPLFLLLVVKEIIEIINNNWTLNFLNSFFLIVLFTMLLWGSICLVKLLIDVNSYQKEHIKITSKQNTTDQHFLGYFSLFVLFAISFEIEMYSMAIIFFLVIAMIAIVYIKNDMYFINPLLNILGYSFYNISYISQSGEEMTTKAFYKGALKINNEYLMCTKYSNIFFVKDIKWLKKNDKFCSIYLCLKIIIKKRFHFIVL